MSDIDKMREKLLSQQADIAFLASEIILLRNDLAASFPYGPGVFDEDIKKILRKLAGEGKDNEPVQQHQST